MGRVDHTEAIATTVVRVSQGVLVVAAIGVLIFALANKDAYENIMTQAQALADLRMNVIAPVVVFGTLTTLVIGLLGLASLQWNVRLMLFAYLVITFTLIVCEAAIAAFISTLSAETAEPGFKEDSAVGYQNRMLLQNYMKCCGWDYWTQEFFPERIACAAVNPQFSQTCKVAVQGFIDGLLHNVFIADVAVVSLTSFSFVATLVLVCRTSDKKEEDYFDNAFSA